MDSTRQIAIIGGGIGGLTAALALRQKHVSVTVFEAAPAMKPVGAGIVMANNAMQIFRRMGIVDQIEAYGNRVSRMSITDHRLKPISEIDLLPFERKYGVCNLAIHRADLQGILAGELGSESLKLGKRLLTIEKEEEYNLNFADGSREKVGAVIGADGIRSQVRRQCFNEGTIRGSGQVCWRGVLDAQLPGEFVSGAVELWGKGKRFGFVKINQKQVYWYASVNEHLTAGRSELPNELFREFHPICLNLVKGTAPESVFFDSITDLKPITEWVKGRVALIGDAAHATTPNLGQGACQAVEDAFALSQIYSTDRPLEETFLRYQGFRQKKAWEIVRQSRTLGEISQWENNLLISLRNRLMSWVPERANSWQMAKLFELGDVVGLGGVKTLK